MHHFMRKNRKHGNGVMTSVITIDPGMITRNSRIMTKIITNLEKMMGILEFHPDGHLCRTEGRTVIWMKDDDFVPSFFHPDERDE